MNQNPELIALQMTILNQGVKMWNDWRSLHPEFHPEFFRMHFANFGESEMASNPNSHVVFDGINLSECFFYEVNFMGCDFNSADFSNSHLMTSEFYSKMESANFKGARLDTINFSQSELNGTDFSNSSMEDCIFIESQLMAASFENSDIKEVNFNRAWFHQTDFTGATSDSNIFASVSLDSSIGLDTITHFDSSSVGIDTIFNSSGHISPRFLRGCGVPQDFITYMQSLVNDPVQYNSCFISYSHKDESFARKLHYGLTTNDLRVWYAAEDMKAGEKIHEQIDAAIQVHDRLLLVLSEHSMESEWVKTEIYNARQREIKEKRRILFPISLVPFSAIKAWKFFDGDSGKDLGREIREYYIPDFSNWKDHDVFEQEFGKLLRDLKAATGR